MATADQLAAASTRKIVESIEEELEAIEKKLRKYDPLIQQRTKLQAARRALLNERSATGGGGGRGLSQAEVVDYMREHSDEEGVAGFTVYDIAKGLGVTEAVVRGHLNRGKDERFEKAADNKWDLREPEDDPEDDDD